MQNVSCPTQHAFVCVHVATLEQRIEVWGGEGEQLSGRFPSVIRREEGSGGEGGVVTHSVSTYTISFRFHILIVLSNEQLNSWWVPLWKAKPCRMVP